LTLVFLLPLVAEAQWLKLPILRRAEGRTPFLNDILGHLHPSMGNQYFDRDPITWGHETTHGVNSYVRNTYGKQRQNGFYVGGGQAIVLDEPALRLSDVVVPTKLRGSRYQLYFVQQQKDWNNEPLYICDEWVAYTNGSTVGLEWQGFGNQRDDMISCVEFSGYALSLAATISHLDPGYFKRCPQFKDFLSHELKRSIGVYSKGIERPDFAWDRQLATEFKRSPEIKATLQSLYGDSLTIDSLFARRN
jgi:hypothetical protein